MWSISQRRRKRACYVASRFHAWRAERATPAQLETAALDMLAIAQETANTEPPAGKRKGKAKRDEARDGGRVAYGARGGMKPRTGARGGVPRAGKDRRRTRRPTWIGVCSQPRAAPSQLWPSRARGGQLVYATSDAATPDAFAVDEAQQFPSATPRPMPSVNEALATTTRTPSGE